MHRIILAVKPQLLCDTLRRRIDEESDLTVVGHVDNDLDLLMAVKANEATVVIHSWDSPALPGICTHLLHEFPGLTLVGIGPDGDQAVLCEQRITCTPVTIGQPGDLLSTVRRAAQSSAIHV